ncbi:hypothetical protein [Pectobacterium carotovorum]|uniref:hypothetical protein n=1 Tax=Pectobacterium carotovorum TaxID=554 RepID=UPI00057FC81B|nr:hypothetical protein [Pectobacterium carotovorum]KHT26551.1 hypothetical protein RC98_12565 [Pectobacterium carotovorum subsp. carotovorum]
MSVAICAGIKVFTAPAGINRGTKAGLALQLRVPRASGDKPIAESKGLGNFREFPASAGINRSFLIPVSLKICVPRASGDKPRDVIQQFGISESSPCQRG